MSKILQAYHKQQREIRRVIAKYRSNIADIDEIAQDVFLTALALEQREKIRAPEHLLLRIAKHLAIDEARKKINKTSESLEDSVDLAAYADERQLSPEEMLNGRQKLLMFAEALAQLRPDHRRVFVMRRVDGLKYDQIATRLNLSRSAVEKRMAAAMTAFAAIVRKQGFELEDFSGPRKPRRGKGTSVARLGEGRSGKRQEH